MEHERREALADPEPRRVRRSEAPAPAFVSAMGARELLALQRSVGNHRVAALLARRAAPRRALMRKVGFEFQTGVRLEDAKGFTRNTPIEDHGAWTIDPDEIEQLKGGGEQCDLEYVTVAFEETDVVGLRTAMEQMRDHAQALKPDQTLGARTKVTSRPSIVTAAPQATVGVTLDKIGALIDATSAPILKGMVPETKQAPTLFGMTSDGPKNLGTARTMAIAAVQNAPGNKKKKASYPRVEGFLTLIYSYLLSSVDLEKDKDPLKYAKLLAPMMSRTNFRAMYLSVEREIVDLLGFDSAEAGEKHFWTDEQLRAYWTTKGPNRNEDVENTLKDEFPRWILGKSGIKGGVPVFPGGYKTPDLPKGAALAGPTREEWLRSIAADGMAALDADVQGQKQYMELLSNVKNFDPSRTDLLSPVPFGSTSMGLRVKPSGKKDQYEVANPFETNPKELRALLELRRLPKGVPAAQWADYALAVQAAMLLVSGPGPTPVQPAPSPATSPVASTAKVTVPPSDNNS